tara:strand:- start:44 stop:1150 length:1107 start_codon:yes stop_codon:yes gene_type:complete
MPNIKYIDDKIEIFLDKVDSIEDEKMFAMSILYMNNGDIQENRKYAWSSSEEEKSVWTNRYNLFSGIVENVRVLEEDQIILDEKINFEGKNVVVEFHSRNLGDTIALMHVMNRFKSDNNCNMFLNPHNKEWDSFLFEITDDIKNITSISKDQIDYSQKFSFKFGETRTREMSLYENYQDFLNVNEPLKITIKEIPDIEENIPKPYICFSEFASNSNKEWKYEGGWQQVIDHFTDSGYTMVNISKEESNLTNCLNLTGEDRDLMHRLGTIKDSEFCIFLDTGLSWVANLIDKHCFLIKSVYSDKFSFQDHQTPISLNSDSYCRGCWDNNNYFWDSVTKECFTRKDFECSRLITPEMVINTIETKLTEGI